MWRYISREQLAHPYLPGVLVKQLNRVFLFSNLAYLLAIALSFVTVFFSYFIYLGVTVYIMFRQLRPAREIQGVEQTESN
jgi:hypothetical protein